MCQQILKNKKTCKKKANHTIYCSIHVHLAIDKIIKLQKWFRQKIYMRNIQKRGVAYYVREICNNPCDFYTLDEMQYIPDKYFITYYDTDNKKIWGHDIRSLHMLFQQNIYNNPYTTLLYSDNFIKCVKDFIQKMKEDDFISFFYEYHGNETECVKRKAIDVFSAFNQIGFLCSHEWISQMNKFDLIKLYYDFKDIICYRAYLSDEQIYQIFGSYTPFDDDVPCFFNKTDIQITNIILDKLMMILNNHDNTYKEQGILLFMTVLTNVSYEAMEAFPYLYQ